MEIEKTPLSDCYIIHFSRQIDARGSFTRSFDYSEFLNLGLPHTVDHTAEAFNKNSLTLRGMHFQESPMPDAKLVRCTSGAAFDVSVDLRRQSPTFKQWYGLVLSENDLNKALYVPAGFAHGYLTLRDETTMSYHLFTPYAAELQRGFRFDDPEIGIEWPEAPLVIAERDANLPAYSSLDRELKNGLS